MSAFLLFLFLVQPFAWANAEEFFGTVEAVLDGDTVMLARDNAKSIKVRLAGIDAPEKDQEYGLESKKSLRELVLRKMVKVTTKAVDDYGRLVAQLDVGHLNVNQEQVRRGMAWDFSRFQGNREMVALQREAQLAKRGLWAGKLIVQPAQWRKQHPPMFSKPTDNAPSTQSTISAPSARPAQSGRAAPSGRAATVCGKKYCSEMASCLEAQYYQAHCHIKTLDGDGDGKPCERLCAATK